MPSRSLPHKGQAWCVRVNFIRFLFPPQMTVLIRTAMVAALIGNSTGIGADVLSAEQRSGSLLTELFYLSFYLSFFPFPLLGRPPPVLLVNGVAVFANFICSHRCFVEGIPAEWCRLADINITR